MLEEDTKCAYPYPFFHKGLGAPHACTPHKPPTLPTNLSYPPTIPDVPKEIKSLYRRFRRLDRTGRGTLCEADLLIIPEVIMNPLAKRLVAMFDKDSEGRINFRSFARGLSVLGERASLDVRIPALFRIYDYDGDGFITGEDIKTVVTMATGSELPEGAIEDLVRQTIESTDKDGDGKISLDDFRQTSVPWESFTVPVSKSARENYRLQQQIEEERKRGDEPF
jgi:Ca2+-binding EF-hand superfamily protein